MSTLEKLRAAIPAAPKRSQKALSDFLKAVETGRKPRVVRGQHFGIDPIGNVIAFQTAEDYRRKAKDNFKMTGSRPDLKPFFDFAAGLELDQIPGEDMSVPT